MNVAKKLKEVHVAPLGDLVDHTLSRQCCCNPNIETCPGCSCSVVIHAALDRREKFELIPFNKRKPVEQTGPWAIYKVGG